MVEIITGPEEYFPETPEEALANALRSSPEFSDDHLALLFTQKHAAGWVHVAQWGYWLSRGNAKWERDHSHRVRELIRALCREIGDDVVANRPELGEARKRLAKTLTSEKTVRAVERMASYDRAHARVAAQFDVEPMEANCPRGVIDLETGKVRPRTEHDYYTKCLAVSPVDADCPQWSAFLRRITAGDQAFERYLQRFAGYCLTGLTKEHSFHFVYGPGGNGKSVFVSTLAGVLADYALAVDPSVFLEARGERHPVELAQFRGARLVYAVEVQGRWAEGRIKTLSGGDRIAARFLYGDFFEFDMQAKLLLVGNHRPSLRTVDDGMRRRLHLMPFDVHIPETERDRDLSHKLRDEWPMILNWMINGCLAWQELGLRAPERVRVASAEYLESQDVLGQWLEECIESDPGGYLSTKDLHASYQRWATERGERFMGEKSLSQAIEDRGYQRKRTSQHKGFAGIRFRDRLL